MVTRKIPIAKKKINIIPQITKSIKVFEKLQPDLPTKVFKKLKPKYYGTQTF